MPQQEQDSRPEWMDSSPFFREDGVLDLLLEHKWELLALAASAFFFRKSIVAPGENPYLVPLPLIRERLRAATRARLDEPIKQGAKRGIASGKSGPGITKLVTTEHMDDQLSSIILDSHLPSREIYERIIHEGVPYIDELMADMDNPTGRLARGIGSGDSWRGYSSEILDPGYAMPLEPYVDHVAGARQYPHAHGLASHDEDVWNEDDTLNLDKFKIKEDEKEKLALRNFFGTPAHEDRLSPIMGYGQDYGGGLVDWRGLAKTAGTYGAIARLIYELNKPRDISGPDDKGSVRIDPGRRR